MVEDRYLLAAGCMVDGDSSWEATKAGKVSCPPSSLDAPSTP
jgi:hypothetical protein